MVFACFHYRGLLLGVDLAVACECELPLFNVCLLYDIYILGGFFGGFFRVLLDGFSLFRLGIAKAPLTKGWHIYRKLKKY